MPYPIANLTKQAMRLDVASVLGDNWPLETTSGGTASAAIFSSLIGTPIAAIQNKYLMVEEGEETGEYRVAISFLPSTGSVTVRRAYSGVIATAMTCHLHEYSPHIYTLAINEAIRDLYTAVYRPILHHTFIRQTGLQRTIPMARDMERVVRVLDDRTSSERVRDYFDRTASATDPGSKWTASTGTWGITSESLYSPGDTDADLLLTSPNPYVQDGVLQAVVRGDTTTGASRVFSLVFRYEDSSNYLMVRLLNGQVDLRKMDGGTESSLTTGTVTTTEDVDYVVRVMFQGSWIDVWVDDRQYIRYELLGTNLKYLGYTESDGNGTFGNAGVRLDKTGAPSLAVTATRLRDYFLHALVGTRERTDWNAAAMQSANVLEMRRYGRGMALVEGRMLWLEGIAPLSQLAADVTVDSITADTTAVVEMLSTDPAYELLIQWAAYVVLRQASSIAFTSNPEKRAEYREAAERQFARALRLRTTKSMSQKLRAFV